MSRPAAYLLACVAVIIGILFRIPLASVLGSEYAYLQFYPAVIIAAWVGGFGPGFLATMLSVLAAAYLYQPPISSFRIERATDLVATGFFFAMGTVLSSLLESRRRALLLAARQRDDAERANRLKDEFLMTLSHELRTPLNAVLGWSRMLRTAMLDDTQRERAFDVIERNARTQVELVEDLLDMSRIITGKLRLNVQPVDVAQAVAKVVESARPAAEAKRLRVDVIDGGGTVLVNADSDRLQQIIWNLVSNALKFTPDGGNVEIRVERTPTHAIISVRDTGKGIDATLLPHIFDRFLQGESVTTRHHSGLGLGLSIVCHLVEAHGGTVAAESGGDGHGARFVVKLPIVAPPQDAQRDADRLAPAPIASLDRIRILMVDANQDGGDQVTAMLRQAGADVRVERTAPSALDTVDAWRPHVLVADISRVDDVGYLVIRSLRDHERRDARLPVPAVALTAHGPKQDRSHALDAGFHAHVSKPVEAGELTTLVAALVEDRG